MASARREDAHGFDAQDVGADWLARYRVTAPVGDVSALGSGWDAVFAELALASQGDLGELGRRAARQVDEIGGRSAQDERGAARDEPEHTCALSPLPLAIDAHEWATIADGISQRAELLESVLGDIYGDQRLIADGHLPAACLNGSAHFLRPMVGVRPAGAGRLHVCAVDLVRAAGGTWRVTADHVRRPLGLGQALANRLALSRVLPGLQSRLHVERLAPFFADLRAGIAASCRRVDPRIALLATGDGGAHDAEQAHLARYLGLMLVESGDLTTHDNRLYLRTVQGLKRVDALWHGFDSRALDPLAFDSTSRLGVAGLADAIAAHEVSVVNAMGVGVIESNAMQAFLPKLCEQLTGQTLRLDQVATDWGGAAQIDQALHQDDTTIAPAFTAAPRALPDGPRLVASLSSVEHDSLIDDLRLRPIDYVARRLPVASTLPAIVDGAIVARRFSLRVFAARDAAGGWSVMPGGLVTIGGEGQIASFVTDLVVVADAPVAPATLMTPASHVTLRRNPGTLPSRVADNLFWLGRYLERADTTLALVRGALGGSSDVDGGAMLGAASRARLNAMLVAIGAAPRGAADVIGAALDDPNQPASVASLLHGARLIAARSRERLSTDVSRLLDRPMPVCETASAGVTELAERMLALAGLASEQMTRSAGWRFLDLGRRIERAIAICRLLRDFCGDGSTADDLSLLLELTNSAMSYRQRYPAGLAALAVRDLVALDPSNPRGLAFQIDRILEHLEALPRLADDGMAEPQQTQARKLAARLATLSAGDLGGDATLAIEQDLFALSDSVALRFFMRGVLPLRAAGLTLG